LSADSVQEINNFCNPMVSLVSPRVNVSPLVNNLNGIILTAYALVTHGGLVLPMVASTPAEPKCPLDLSNLLAPTSASSQLNVTPPNSSSMTHRP
jgi:hypothetical protein